MRTPTSWKPVKVPVSKPKPACPLDTIVQDAVNDGLTEQTQKRKAAKWAEWIAFCGDMDINSDNFVSPEPFPSKDQIEAEQNAIAKFMAYLIAYPAIGNKTLTMATVTGKASAVCTAYSLNGVRRPGCTAANPNGQSTWLKRVERGLSTKAAPPLIPRRPITQGELRAMRNVLDLENNALHRVWWAGFLLMYQGVCRASDFLPRRGFDANKNVTRANVRAARVVNEDGSNGPPKLIIVLARHKTDRAGVKGVEKHLVYDASPGALSTAVAIRNMIRMDSNDTADALTPMFRHPVTKQAINVDAIGVAFNNVATTEKLDMARLAP